jgi:HD superfamily phosphodiesterase
MTKSKSSEDSRLADGVKYFVRDDFRHSSDVSAAHNFGHVDRVATGAYLIVKALGGTEREAEAARAGGYLHDLVRSHAETGNDEQLSVEKATPLLSQLVKSGTFTEWEKSAILASIETMTVPNKLLNSEEKNRPSYFLEDRTRLVKLAVFLADKLEANGAYVIARRSQFVGGERFHIGDLKYLAEKFDPEMAILLESYLRLGVKNKQSIYPEWFKPVVNKLFERQREFYYALLSDKGLQESDLARMLIELKFPEADAEKIKEYEKTRSDSRIQIAAVTPEQTKAALEVVKFFSAPENMRIDTAGLIRKFNPTTQKAKEWHEEMLSYLQGGIGSLISELKIQETRINIRS